MRGKGCDRRIGTFMHFVWWPSRNSCYEPETDEWVLYKGMTDKTKKICKSKTVSAVNIKPAVRYNYRPGMRVNHVKWGSCKIDRVSKKIIVIKTSVGNSHKLDKKTVCERTILVPVNI